MAAWLYHQNMRNFGGGLVRGAPGDRETAFAAAFARLSAGMGSPHIVVAGFTEVTNRQASVQALQRLVPRLHADLEVQGVIHCGESALDRREGEFVAIAVSASAGPGAPPRPVAFNPLSLGRVIVETEGGRARVRLDPWTPWGGPAASRALPAAAPHTFRRMRPVLGNDAWSLHAGGSSDYRVFVYTVGWIGPAVAPTVLMPAPAADALVFAPGAPANVRPSGPAGYPVVAVVFIHNRYQPSQDDQEARKAVAKRHGLTPQPASKKRKKPGEGKPAMAPENVLVMAQVPKVLDVIMRDDPFRPTSVFLGGDFNQPPERRHGRPFDLEPLYAEPDQLLAPLNPPPGTTSGGNTYDYWYAASIAPGAPAGARPALVLADPLRAPGYVGAARARLRQPRARAGSQTVDKAGGLSDHAGILLQVQ